MKLNRRLITPCAVSQFAFTSWGADEAATNSGKDITSEQQIDDLDHKIRILERQRELDANDAKTVTQMQPLMKLDANGSTLVSAVSNFNVSPHNLVHLDSRTFFQNAAPNVDVFLVRRARPIMSGAVTKKPEDVLFTRLQPGF